MNRTRRNWVGVSDDGKSSTGSLALMIGQRTDEREREREGGEERNSVTSTEMCCEDGRGRKGRR